MPRINWLQLIQERFNEEPFTGDDIEKATGVGRERVRDNLTKLVKKKKLKKLKDGTYRLITKEASVPPALRKLLKALAEKFGDSRFSNAAVQETTGFKRTDVHGRIHDLKSRGLVKRVTRGVYVITDKGHNALVEDFKKEAKEIEKPAAPECLPSCVLLKMESVLGKDAMKEWVYATAITNEECVEILEREAVNAVAKNLTVLPEIAFPST